MKKILSFLFLFLAVGVAYSQSLEFVYKDKVLNNNEKITITEADAELENQMEFKALIRNKTNDDVNVIVTKEIITPAESGTDNFCTAKGCYLSNKSEKYTISAKGVDNVFHGTFKPVKASSLTVKYTATALGSLGDAVSVIVTYQYTPTGIEQVGYQHLSISQQNRIVTINYQNAQDTNLQIVDLLGNIVGTYKLSANTNSVNIDLTPKSGLFLFVFSNKKSRFTQKYIIK